MLGIGQIGSAIGRIGATTPNKGGGVIVTSTVLNDSRIMRDSTRMTDNG